MQNIKKEVINIGDNIFPTILKEIKYQEKMLSKNSTEHPSEAKKATILFWTLLLLWIVCDIFQGAYMEVMSDEAYYAFYGQHLAIGYYDHPPMIGVLNFLSSCFFSGNLSVRFANVLMHGICVWIIWRMLPNRNKVSNVLLYFAIAFAFIMFSAYGFITTPDGALLFFTAAFLFFYERFLKQESWANVLFLTLTMVGMFYSKYHAVLVIGFVVLSNLRLLQKPRFWLCILATAILFLPHVYWQISNDFPSFRYHLIGRNHGLLLVNILKYFPEQFAVFNPIALAGVIYIIIKKKADNLFDRSLFFIIGGTFLFFQLMTLKGRVEAHWTIVATIPMILLLYKYSMQDLKFRKIILRGSLCIIPLILIFRVILVMGILPRSFALNGKEKNHLAIEKVAGSLPVVFTGSFQDPSLYHYFTGKPSFSLSTIPLRTTQFDIWDFDKNYQDSTVFVYAETPAAQKYKIDNTEFSGFIVKHLQTTNSIDITYSKVPDKVHIGDTLRIQYELFNPYSKDIDMNHPELPVEFCSIFNGPNIVATSPCYCEPALSILKAGETIKGELITVVPNAEPSSEYIFGLTLKTPISTPYNSPFVKMQLSENN